MKNNFSKYIVCCFLLIVFSCKEEMKVSKEVQIEQKVDSLLKLMTLEEKIGQMSQIRHFEESADEHITEKFIGSIIHTEGPSPGITALDWQKRFTELQKKALSSRLGIPLLFAVDAVHGQNTFEGATIFTHNIGLGATQNEALVEKIASITALESQATGFNWVFSPCIAIPFNEKWGRVYEAFSESTELTEKLTKASVKGHQGVLSDAHTVMATAKHFIGDGATDYGVEGGETSLNSKQIQKRLLAPYKIAVKENIGAVMASFNTIAGISMHAHKALITDTLKVGMNFDGIVVSDWKGYSRFGKNDIINAGIDVVMAVDGDLEDFQEGLIAGVEDKTVKISRIDDAVKRILRQKFRLGLFENPFPEASLISKIGIKEHRDIARQAVRESLVLLKNEKNVLPLSKETKKIVVVGEHANSSGLQSGGWTINWQGTRENYKGATTILEGIKNHSNGEVVYDKDGTQNYFDADVAIIVIGEIPYAEFFGDIDHESNQLKLTLTEAHQNYIKTYQEEGIKTVVVLVSGRPMVVTKQIEKSDAFIAAWLLGSEGDGVAEVLFGDFNFSGKLPHSWPKGIKDYQSKYGPNFWDNTKEPLFKFGYGLKH
jgi:beta-glucosidase